jgi:hypothetical protein
LIKGVGTLEDFMDCYVEEKKVEWNHLLSYFVKK